MVFENVARNFFVRCPCFFKTMDDVLIASSRKFANFARTDFATTFYIGHKNEESQLINKHLIEKAMKPIKLFYLEKCPFCKKAFQYIQELQEEHPELKAVEIETIEESKKPEVANQYDYYYVPTFYIDEVKEHEAGIFKNEVEALLRKALEA